MTRRPVLRTALFGIWTSLVAVTVIAVWLGVASHRLHERQAAASATARGTVVADGLGDEGDIRVRWRDHAGRQHEQRFGIYDTDRYRRGATFDVRYDPEQPDQRAFAADPEETSATDDLEVPIGIAALLAALNLAAWAWRGGRFRRQRGRPATSALFGQALSGEILDGAPISVGATSWIGLRHEVGAPVVAWQRVMHHPALSLAAEVTPLHVRGDVSGRRGVVVELPDGTALVPIGRLRHKEPRRYLLTPRVDISLADDDLFIVPAGTVLPPPRPWWHAPLRFVVVGALIGVVMALLFGGGAVAIVPFAVGAAAFLANLWAFTGAEA